MTPQQFKGANTTYRGPDCEDLPALSDGREVLTCWRLSWRERFSALFFGTVWLCIQGGNQPPVWLKAERSCFQDEREG